LLFRYWPTKLDDGISKYRSSQYAAAAVQFQRAVGENPDLVTGWLYLGASYARQWYSDLETGENRQLASKASEAFKAALQIDPKNKVALAGLIYVGGVGEKTLEYEREFNEVEPGNIFHTVMLGDLDLLICRGRIEDFATTNLRVADFFGFYPRLNETARKELAEKLQEQNNGPFVDEGIKAYSKALQIKPNDPEITGDLSQMYFLSAVIERDGLARANDLKASRQYYSMAMTARKVGERSVMDPLPELRGSGRAGEDDFSFLMGLPQTSPGYIALPPPPPVPPPPS